MTPAYQAFGLRILSEIEFPNLPPATAAGLPEVRIQVGSLPARLPGAPESPRYFQAAQGKLLVRIKDVGRMLVEDGQSITFEPLPGGEPVNVRLALSNLGLSAILHQRGALALHASAVAAPGGAVLFCGARQAGKSTLAAGLHQRGWSLVCDDKAALRLDAGRVMVLPSFPELRLWRNAIQQLDFAGARSEQTPGMDKYNLGIAAGFQETPLPLRAIYLLRPAEVEDIHITPLKGMGKFQVIKRNTYTNQFLKDLGLLPAHFSLASAVASQVEMALVARPSQVNRLEALISIMDARLRGEG
jgi:hypothetical protein